MAPIISIYGSTLLAVPAVHYRAVFAWEVNKLCSRESTRPDAIAVELSPQIVNEIQTLMKELGIRPFSENILPCMLGILVNNRLIHPDYRDTALLLQRHFKKPLNEIDEDLQKQLLHYSDKYLVAISSSDSIIEAIRCGIELNIPVYGVDLDEFATGTDNNRLLIKDPSITALDLTTYVSQNEKPAARMRDPYIDARREHVMTARLKAILLKHKKVLFTGGLAHWEMIRKHLDNSAVRPAEIFNNEVVKGLNRIIIHPVLAVKFIDSYPILNTRYEETRHNPSVGWQNVNSLPDTGQIYQDVLHETYEKYLTDCDANGSGRYLPKGRLNLPDFERLLDMMRLVSQLKVLTMAAMLEVANSIMADDFCGLLTSNLMDIGRPWASQDQFPDLPVMSPIPVECINRNYATSDELFQLIEVQLDKEKQNLFISKRSSPFSVKYHQETGLKKESFRFWKWNDEPKEELWPSYSNTWVWPPCESLLFGTAYEASKIAVSESGETDSAIFEGSLYEGIDLKASVRSIIRGEKYIYIKKPSLAKKTFHPDGKKPEPTVFIFEDNNDNLCEWSLLMGGSNMGNHVKNKERFYDVVSNSGSNFISSISRTYNMEVPAHLKHYVESISILKGIIAFGNPCINASQGAQWVEDNDFQCCPVLPNTGFHLLIDYYKQHYQMDMSKDDWKTALLRFALPYARKRVVVIAPVGYRISNKLYEEAKRKKICLSILPLNYFPEARITEMRQRLMVRALDSDGYTFSHEVEEALGQRSDKYLELLPLYMQQQLGKYS
jgi:hypothetical protein